MFQLGPFSQVQKFENYSPDLPQRRPPSRKDLDPFPHRFSTLDYNSKRVEVEDYEKKETI